MPDVTARDETAPSVTVADERPDDVDLTAVGVTAESLESHPRAGLVSLAGFEGEIDQTALIEGEDGPELLVGLGAAAELDRHALRRAGAVLARAASKAGSLAVDALGELPSGVEQDGAAQALAEGIVLGAYGDARFKSEEDDDPLAEVVVVAPGSASAVERGAAVAAAVLLARDLVNEPGGSLVPEKLAQAARHVATEAGLDVEVLDEDGIAEAGYGGLLGVNRGSDNPPRFITLAHRPDEPRARIALVGKGITFDAGGLSIKSGEAMMTMKMDMAGAAAVIAAMSVIPLVAPDVEVVARVPATDNMLGGDATRPGDVLTMADGTTVEVLNTDAEGRLVLADALVAASADEPDLIVDLATLTGACMVALGPRIAGLMANDDDAAAQVASAAERAGERVWRLPLPEDYRAQLDSPIADLKNVGTRYGGSLTAGLFLSTFVADDVPWVHLDIAGPAYLDEAHAEHPKGATGFGVRTLAELASGL